MQKRQSKHIENICRSEGYTGSVGTLSNLIAEERKHCSNGTIQLSLRQKTLNIIWDFKEGNHTELIKKLHPGLVETFPDLLEIDIIVGSFHRLFIEKRHDGLRKWLMKYKSCNFPHICTFINEIKKDIKAVWHSIIHPWSNGPVEGHVNRLKTIKRMMYGRGSFELLRNRFLYKI